MKSKLIVLLCATAALAGCEQSQDQMNEPAGAERPGYQAPARSTNAPSQSTNENGTSAAPNAAPNNGANSSGSENSATP